MPRLIVAHPEKFGRPGEIYYMPPDLIPRLPDELSSYLQLLLYCGWTTDMQAGRDEDGKLDPGNRFVVAGYRRQRFLVFSYDGEKGVTAAEIYHWKTPEDKTDVTDVLLQTIYLTDRELSNL